MLTKCFQRYLGLYSSVFLLVNPQISIFPCYLGCSTLTEVKEGSKSLSLAFSQYWFRKSQYIFSWNIAFIFLTKWSWIPCTHKERKKMLLAQRTDFPEKEYNFPQNWKPIIEALHCVLLLAYKKVKIGLNRFNKQHQ